MENADNTTLALKALILDTLAEFIGSEEPPTLEQWRDAFFEVSVFVWGVPPAA
jgi:hypothetical protein